MAALIPRIVGQRYDSQMSDIYLSVEFSDYKYFDLSIIIRVFLQRLDPPFANGKKTMKDADGTPVECQRWPDTKWREFNDFFFKTTQTFWTRRFRLTPPANCRVLDYTKNGQTTQRQVITHLALEPMAISNNAHVTIRCVCRKDPSKTFRSHSFLYDDGDLPMQPMTEREKTWPHWTMFHEAGHLLDLPHSNEASKACRRAPNSGICYGASLGQKLNVMGEGYAVGQEHATPWLQRAARHTQSNLKYWWAEPIGTANRVMLNSGLSSGFPKRD